MALHDELKRLGLHTAEIKVYLYVLENGLSTPPQIAKGTGIARTNCYHLLRSLDEKNLIETQPSRRRKAYVARDPESIVTHLNAKREAAERIVPELRGLYASQKNKPKIRYFSGWGEVQEIYRHTFEGEKVFGIGNTEQLSAVDPKFFKWYIAELQTRKIIFDDILTASAEDNTATAIGEMRGALHTIKFLPKETDDVPTDILIWNDNVALITLKEPVFGTIITDASLAKTFKALSGILWEKL